jgi:alpha-D-xyloside xylohydrolase
MGPAMEWAMEKPADPIELRIYPGADGDFTFYEDENDNYNYTKGAHATIALRWDDAAKTLTVGGREGSFPGMLATRTFKVVVVGKDHGTGVGETTAPNATVTYTGEKVTVKL